MEVKFTIGSPLDVANFILANKSPSVLKFRRFYGDIMGALSKDDMFNDVVCSFYIEGKIAKIGFFKQKVAPCVIGEITCDTSKISTVPKDQPRIFVLEFSKGFLEEYKSRLAFAIKSAAKDNDIKVIII